MLPESLEEIDQARNLLGCRGKGADLSPRVRRRLEALIGCYPDPALAVRYKGALTALRSEIAAGELS